MFDYKNPQHVLSYCKKAHGDQIRKYLKIPYWVHPQEVSEIVKTIEFTPNYCHTKEEIYAAAMFHDIIEDTDVTPEKMTLDFNERITELVLQVTNVSKYSDGNRALRNYIEIRHLSNGCPCGKTIKLADLISNTQSILTFDKGFAIVYLKEKEKLLPYLSQGAPELFEIASKILETSMGYLARDDEIV